jgi:hypothetical protein
LYGAIASANAVVTVSAGGTPTSPGITAISSNGGQVSFGFATENGFSYKVQFTSDLNSAWVDVETITGTGSVVSRNYSIGTGKGFYRIIAF